MAEFRTGYKLKWKAVDEKGVRRLNQWMVGDQLLCQSFNRGLKVGTQHNASNKYYWAKVVEVSDNTEEPEYNWVVINTDDYDGTLDPEVGDVCVQLGYRGGTQGYTNPQEQIEAIRRGSAIYISAYNSMDYGITAPFIAQYMGINDYSNLGAHRQSYFDATGAKFRGNIELGGKSLEQYINDKINGSGDGDGDQTKYITNTVVDYQIGESGQTPPSGSWQSSVPELEKGKYLWTRITFHYSDNTTTTSYSVSYIPNDGSVDLGDLDITQMILINPKKELVKVKMDADETLYVDFEYQITKANIPLTSTELSKYKMTLQWNATAQLPESKNLATIAADFREGGEGFTYQNNQVLTGFHTDWTDSITDALISLWDKETSTIISTRLVPVSFEAGALLTINQDLLKITATVEDNLGNVSQVLQRADEISSRVTDFIGRSRNESNLVSLSSSGWLCLNRTAESDYLHQVVFDTDIWKCADDALEKKDGQYISNWMKLNPGEYQMTISGKFNYELWKCKSDELPDIIQLAGNQLLRETKQTGNDVQTAVTFNISDSGFYAFRLSGLVNDRVKEFCIVKTKDNKGNVQDIMGNTFYISTGQQQSYIKQTATSISSQITRDGIVRAGINTTVDGNGNGSSTFTGSVIASDFRVSNRSDLFTNTTLTGDQVMVITTWQNAQSLAGGTSSQLADLHADTPVFLIRNPQNGQYFVLNPIQLTTSGTETIVNSFYVWKIGSSMPTLEMIENNAFKSLSQEILTVTKTSGSLSADYDQNGVFMLPYLNGYYGRFESISLGYGQGGDITDTINQYNLFIDSLDPEKQTDWKKLNKTDTIEDIIWYLYQWRHRFQYDFNDISLTVYQRTRDPETLIDPDTKDYIYDDFNYSLKYMTTYYINGLKLEQIYVYVMIYADPSYDKRFSLERDKE